jgi:ATP-dependent DNA helicase Q1
VTYWRAADASRLSGLTYETFNTGGKEKRAFPSSSLPSIFSLTFPANSTFSPVYEVVSFAENKTTCRKILFSSYFSSAYNRAEAFDAEDGDAPCGHCDNVRLPLFCTFPFSADTV